MPKPIIIEVTRLTQKYGSITAVNDLDLSIHQGVCFGLLGPNGAGKTTLIEIIEGITEPVQGQVRYRGRRRSTEFKEKIGIMFQQTALLSFLTVEETLSTFSSLYRKNHDIETLIRLCHLNEIRRQPNDKISGGQRQRLLLALALINDPDLLFLDEPSTGLDPQARRNLWDIIQAVKEQNKTIVLTTHYMEEAQQLCDEVAIMDHGKIIAQGSPQALIDEYCGAVTLMLPRKALKNGGNQIPANWKLTQDQVIIQADDMNQSMRALLNERIDLTHMQVQAPNLETVFLNLTGRKLRN